MTLIERWFDVIMVAKCHKCGGVLSYRILNKMGKIAFVVVLAMSMLSGCGWLSPGQKAGGPGQDVSECHSFGEVDAETADRVLSAISRMMAKSLRPVSDSETRQSREENYLFISNLLCDCKFDCRFWRMDDSTPILIDNVGECEGAYKDIACYVMIDDKYVHGGALFPEADVKNTNVVEFVTLANQIARTGSFEYDSEFGFVMYMNSMPVSAIRSKGKSAFGMVYGFPVMEVDLFSESYKAVLEGRKTPKEAIIEVGEKIDKIKDNDTETECEKCSFEAVDAICKYFKDRGHDARPVKDGDQVAFAGTLTSCKDDGLRNDGYQFHIFVGDEWVRSFVRLPLVASNHQVEVRAYIAGKNRRSHDPCSVLVHDGEDGSVVCRSQINVVEFTGDVENSIIMLLRRPVDILDDCSDVIVKIANGEIDAQTALENEKK